MKTHASAKMSVATLVALASVCLQTAKAQDSFIFDDARIARVQKNFQAGLEDNFKNVIWPVLTPDEQQALADVRIEVIPVGPDRKKEPFVFYTDGQTVFMSANSIAFANDYLKAAIWLERNKFSTESLTNYAISLKSGLMQESLGRPVSVLCIPRNALEDEKLSSRADQATSNLSTFFLLHELGHISRHHFDGDRDLEVSREREADADNFALSVMARLGDSPLSMAPYFLLNALTSKGPEDFRNDSEFADYYKSRTHPLDSERLSEIADSLQENANQFAPTHRLGKLGFIGLSGVIRNEIIPNLTDKSLRETLAARAETMSEAHLAPVVNDYRLGKPCAHHTPLGEGVFAGFWSGTFVGGKAELPANAILRQSESNVTGIINFGKADFKINCIAGASTCRANWAWRARSGHSAIKIENGKLFGTWGDGDATEGDGSFTFVKEP